MARVELLVELDSCNRQVDSRLAGQSIDYSVHRLGACKLVDLVDTSCRWAGKRPDRIDETLAVVQ